MHYDVVCLFFIADKMSRCENEPIKIANSNTGRSRMTSLRMFFLIIPNLYSCASAMPFFRSLFFCSNIAPVCCKDILFVPRNIFFLTMGHENFFRFLLHCMITHKKSSSDPLAITVVKWIKFFGLGDNFVTKLSIK